MTIDRSIIQPSLRDRLREQPASDPRGSGTSINRNGQPSRRRQVRYELAQLRSAVESSLMTLLMTRQPSSVPDWRRWPHAEASVINYGVPDLSGFSVSGLAAKTLRRRLKQTIERFEPRLHAGTVELDIETSAAYPESLLLWVGGDIGPRDAPEAFSLGMSICLVTGHANPIQVKGAA